MTDEEYQEEGAGEQIEDLEAPAEAQSDVAGGFWLPCPAPSAVCPVSLVPKCARPTDQVEQRVP
jgi:hypothetical protein